MRADRFDSLSARDAMRTRAFWLLYGSLLAAPLGLFIPFAHLAPYARDNGLSESAGAWLVGLIGAGSVAGRLLMGGAADRLGRRQSLAVTFAALAALMLWWLASSNFWALAVFALLFGVGYGGCVALWPALAADYFGARNAGAILGFLYTGAGIGTLIGPTLAGVIYDVRESYTLPIIFSGLANLIAVGCVVLLPPTAGWRTPASAPRDDAHQSL